MLTGEFIAELVDDCYNEMEEIDGGSELCAGCPLGVVCSEVEMLHKSIKDDIDAVHNFR